MFAMYLRLGVTVWDSPRDVVRATIMKIDKKSLRDRTKRSARHALYRTMLMYHEKALDLAAQWRL